METNQRMKFVISENGSFPARFLKKVYWKCSWRNVIYCKPALSTDLHATQ